MNLLSYVHLRNIYRSTGAGTVARALVEQFARQEGMELRVLADRGDYERVVPKVGEPWSSFQYCFFPKETSSQQAQWYLFNSPKAESFWHDADIVFCTGESYVPTSKARLVVTMHDAAFFESYAHSRNRAYWTQRLKWRMLYEKLIRKADLFHVVSQFTADRLAHFFPAMKNRLRVVHNGVSEFFFADLDRSADRGFTELKERYVLLPGGLHYRKNAELVLAAWRSVQSSCPDVRLLIVNHSDPAYAARAESLGDSVRLLGYVEKEYLRACYRNAELVWFPSRYEGFGLPVLEAMACRAPVVASDSSSLPEVSGGCAVLVPADRPQEHADAVVALLKDSAGREAMRIMGRAWSEKFRWDQSALKLRSCFEQIL